ncbi:helix-turn-helix domain-containing protein [Nocardiopsis sp. NPDC058789]|uniref:helix-turn-helix domain-containing protein n=1 Tax=Nocardiopsis sp. NPDC058789 TaxID=3346634 RepID=UPI00366B63E6
MEEGLPRFDASSQRALADLLVRLEEGTHPSTDDVTALLGPVDGALVERVRSLSSRLARLRRREGELSALIASTRDLVEVRDVEPLLRRLVDRAHDLVGTDVTYLSVHDRETDELFVRASRGTVSPRFPGLRVPAGAGIASRVVRTNTPQWTSDYGVRDDFDRDPGIDAAIAEEQLRSLVGVPMSANGEILGVLFAADRASRPFAREEIALLSAFADQAAVILHTARLFAAATEAADRAERHSEAMAAAARVHERLTALVLSGHGPHEVALTLAESLGRPVAVADRDHRTVTRTSEAADAWWPGGRLAPAVARALARSRESGHCASVEGPGPDVVVAVSAGAELLGVLLVGAGDAPLSDVERRTIERSGQILALLTMQSEAVTHAEERVRGELALDLFSGAADTDTLRRRASARGIVLDQPWTVVVVPVPDRHRHAAHRSLAVHEGWMAAAQGEGVSVLVPGRDPTAAAEQVAQRVGAATEAPVLAVGSAVGSLADLPAVLTEVWECAAFLPALGVRRGAFEVDDYAPYLAMFGTDGGRALSFVDRVIGPVVAWDARHHSDLTGTITALAGNGGSVTRAARALYVHPNTVKQRLERVTSLLGEDWRSADSLFRVTVATRLHLLRQGGKVTG